jgi:hypothetical protein
MASLANKYLQTFPLYKYANTVSVSSCHNSGFTFGLFQIVAGSESKYKDGMG